MLAEQFCSCIAFILSVEISYQVQVVEVFKASCLSTLYLVYNTEHLLLTSEQQFCSDYECFVVFPVLV